MPIGDVSKGGVYNAPALGCVGRARRTDGEFHWMLLLGPGPPARSTLTAADQTFPFVVVEWSQGGYFAIAVVA